MKIVVIKKTAVMITAALMAGILFAGGAVAVAAGAIAARKKRELPVYSVETDEKKVAISFDCAWGAEYTDSLLKTMAEENVKCTFFTVQFWTEKYPDVVKKIDEAGHEIGTHSATHPKMSGLTETKIKEELTTSSEAITKITGKPVTLFRPPYGDYNDRVITAAKELGLMPVQWDVDSLDWKDLSANEILKRVTGKVRKGSIVLFHNNGLHTAEALPLILKTLKNDGYEFVPIGELIYKGGYYLDGTGRQFKTNEIQ